jgi:hypothetical protein
MKDALRGTFRNVTTLKPRLDVASAVLGSIEIEGLATQECNRFRLGFFEIATQMLCIAHLARCNVPQDDMA